MIVGTFGPRSADEMLRVLAEPEAARCSLVELRLDLVPDAGSHLRALIAAAPVPVLATCRRSPDRDEAARLRLLRSAANCGAAWIDLEHDVPAADVPRVPGVSVLRSVHMERLPDDAAQLVERLLADPADTAKLVALSGAATDAARLLRLIRSWRGRLVGHVVDVPFTRPASVLAGAPFTYAALRPGGRIGLPLPSVRDLLDRDGLVRAGPGTRAWVLLGADVTASVSPQMLNRAFAAAGAPVVALRWSCDDPVPALELIREFGWAGAAVTIPHKETVLRALAAAGDPIDGEAAAVGAVNTVVLRDAQLHGGNTDVGGVLDALAGALPHGLGGATGLVLGAGGAARAAVLAVRRLGGRATVFARRKEAAERLLDVGAAGVATSVADALSTRPALIVDATPAGPPGGTPILDPAPLQATTVVLDMLVDARPTALLERATAAGQTAVPGLSMLAHQAARQVDLLLGRRPEGRLIAADDLRALGADLLAVADRGVVLLGLRCSGKSAVGACVARLLAWPFLDTDTLIADATGRSPNAWIRSGQEDGFRAHEAVTLRGLAQRRRVVVAVGGGAALSPGALTDLCDGAFVVWLDAPDDALLRRFAAAPRASLSALPLTEELARERAERDPVHARLASVLERTVGRCVEEVAETVVAAMEREMPDPRRWLHVP